MQHHTSSAPATIPAADAAKDLVEHQDRIASQFSAIVQAHAALLVFDSTAARVVQTSANLVAVLDAQPEDAPGRRTDELLDEPSARALQTALRDAHPTHPAILPDLHARDARPLIARVHLAGSTPVLEIEPAPARGALDTLDPARLWAGLEPLATDHVIGEDRGPAAADSFPWPALPLP